MKSFILGYLTFCLSSTVLAADICQLYDEQLKNEVRFCFYHCPSGNKVITIEKYERCDHIRNFSMIDGVASEKFALLTQPYITKPLEHGSWHAY